MKNVWMWGLLAVATAISLTTDLYGQQSTAPAYTPAAPGTTSAQALTEEFPSPQGGAKSGADVFVPSSGNGQQPGEIASPATSDTGFRAPASLPGMPSDDRLGGGQVEKTAGQPGELGVWLVESGGPGVLIRRITEGSAADLAGLQSGDVLLQINGRGASSPHGVSQMIRQMPAGQTAKVEFWRDGQANELEIVLQPTRQEHQVAFRGDGSLEGARGDIESRTMRLEQQLAAVIQELRQLRQEMAQLRTSGSGQAAIGGGGVGEATTATGFGAESATGTTTAPGAATTQPGATEPDATAPQADPFGETTEPAAQPDATPAPAPATEPDTGDDNLFGASTTEEPAASPIESATEGAAPAEDDKAPDAAPAETESDDNLFQ